MKLTKIFAAASLIVLAAHAQADDSNTDTDTLLTNLGAYLGFNIVDNFDGEPYSSLLNATDATTVLQNVVYSVFSAVPVNAMTTVLSQFIPPSDGNPNVAKINTAANSTFSSAEFNTSSGSSVSVNEYVDQETYQNDPTSQAILNILGTPDYTYCMNNDATAWLSDCNYLYNYSVVNNIVGTVPAAPNFFSYAYNEGIIPQLNSNTLISPLMYDVSTSAGVAAASGALSASNQAQEAANFVRYATFGAMPVQLPSYQDYSTSYTTATSTTATPQDVANAQNTINGYITNLRTYASLSSVPISNLYYILSKRMPQTTSTNNGTQSSQAMNEYVMATRRLSSQTSSSSDQTWIQSINTASPTTVGKEIALILSEINYQLYLNRVQEERQLLTTSLILMVMARQQMPLFQNPSDTSTNSTTTSSSDTTSTTTSTS